MNRGRKMSRRPIRVRRTIDQRRIKPVAEREKDQLRSRLRSIEMELFSTLSSLSHVKSDINYIEGAMATVPSRLQKVRNQGYEIMSYLDENQEILTRKWDENGQQIKDDHLYNIQPLREEARRLQSEIRDLKSRIEHGDSSWVRRSLSTLSSDVSSLRGQTSNETNRTASSLKEFKSGFSALDRDLKGAENTMQLVSQVSFPWKEGESPILALNAKMMTREKSEGGFFLTNQRILFEGVKEEVTERKFFIATKKKTVRTLLLDQPIGIVKEISGGTVSFWAGAGIYVRFKPDSGLEEIPFDVKREEVDLVKKYYNFIVTGEADLEIAKVRGKEKKVPSKPKVLRCPSCDAPYTREIYRGQTSVQCKYCGSVIPLGS